MKNGRRYTIMCDNADNNTDTFLLMFIWKHVVRNDKKKKNRKNDVSTTISTAATNELEAKRVFLEMPPSY